VGLLVVRYDTIPLRRDTSALRIIINTHRANIFITITSLTIRSKSATFCNINYLIHKRHSSTGWETFADHLRCNNQKVIFSGLLIAYTDFFSLSFWLISVARKWVSSTKC